nr:vegetative cell wall protein gp1-like [Aegilops tauschii subsp. strangulata]
MAWWAGHFPASGLPPFARLLPGWKPGRSGGVWFLTRKLRFIKSFMKSSFVGAIGQGASHDYMPAKIGSGNEPPRRAPTPSTIPAASLSSSSTPRWSCPAVLAIVVVVPIFLPEPHCPVPYSPAVRLRPPLSLAPRAHRAPSAPVSAPAPHRGHRPRAPWPRARVGQAPPCPRRAHSRSPATAAPCSSSLVARPSWPRSPPSRVCPLARGLGHHACSPHRAHPQSPATCCCCTAPPRRACSAAPQRPHEPLLGGQRASAAVPALAARPRATPLPSPPAPCSSSSPARRHSGLLAARLRRCRWRRRSPLASPHCAQSGAQTAPVTRRPHTR